MFFKVTHRSTKSKARRGEIHTAHGSIQTPAFVPVATKGTLKSLTPKEIAEIGVQVSFVNTYHLVTHPGVDIIYNAGGIHKFSQMQRPLMSDSGGFQVFSLAQNKPQARIRDNEEQPLVVKITQDGVLFRSTYDGSLVEFTPEKSMEYQQKIGADFIMAFDECTYYPSAHEYAEKAMMRTHDWLKRCIKHKQLKVMPGNPAKAGDSMIPLHPHSAMPNDRQYLYGIIQGGTFEDLRKISAEFVVSQDVDGVAIGGVSVGETKDEMRAQVHWVLPYLPADKPVHLLGVGQIDDIVDLVACGIDTFDCVEPTRVARMGTIYQIENAELRVENFFREIDIIKGVYKNNLSRIDENCECYVCKNFTKSYLHHLFKQRELLGYTLATYHNLWVMEKFMELVRSNVENNLL